MKYVVYYTNPFDSYGYGSKEDKNLWCKTDTEQEAIDLVEHYRRIGWTPSHYKPDSNV